MTKTDKKMVLNMICGIPMRYLNWFTEEQIDAFVEKHNLTNVVTEEYVDLCKGAKEVERFMRACK